MESEPKSERFQIVEFAQPLQPVFQYTRNKEWVTYGEFNNYPDYLIELYNRDAIHGAIVKGKSSYVYGKGLTYKKESTNILQAAKLNAWLENANRYESWNDVYEKTCKHFELFNGWAWQIIWNNGGTGFEIYAMEFAKLRRSKCKKKVIYCDCWWICNNGVWQINANPEKDPSYKVFDIFNPNVRTGEQVIYFRLDTPTTQKYGDLYPIPDYSGAISDIETDIEISNFHFNNLKNGFFASSLLTFFNGNPTEEEKKKIKKMFNYTYAGTMNTGKVLLHFANQGETPPDIKTLTPADLDKMFEQVSKRLQQNIFTAHRADPVLFGVMTEGSLSDTGGEAILKKWDKFLRTYVEGRQEIILREIKALGTYANIDTSNLEVEQTSPVGVDLPADPGQLLSIFDKATLQKAYGKKYGIEVVIEATDDSLDQPTAQVNENLKKLSGRDWIHIKRVIREVSSGKTTREAGALMLKNGYALSDQDIDILFKTPQGQFSKFEIETRDRTEEILSLFEKFAQDDEEGEILSEEFVHDETEALKFEVKFGKQLFESPFETNPKALQEACIDLLAGNPFLTDEQMAKQLGVNPVLIIAAITALIAGGYIVETAGAFQPTEKAISRNVDQVETETYTVYRYVTRPDVPEVETTSRPFCKRLLKMSREGKVWTRDALESITNEFGEDAWTYRGGFYTNPLTGETTPYCRHIWKSMVKVRTKRKR